MACKKEHIKKFKDAIEKLPEDQGGKGRHKCAACAYEMGYDACLKLKENINIETLFYSLEKSQADVQRHKSPHTAYVAGYLEGVRDHYNH